MNVLGKNRLLGFPGKRNPPLLRYHPPIAGAIYWERQLLHRMKSPVLVFQNVEELRDSELRAFAFEQYAALARQMRAYEDAKFEEFVGRAQQTLHRTMRRNVLTLQSFEKKPGKMEWITKISMKGLSSTEIAGFISFSKRNILKRGFHLDSPFRFIQSIHVVRNRRFSRSVGCGSPQAVITSRLLERLLWRIYAVMIGPAMRCLTNLVLVN